MPPHYWLRFGMQPEHVIDHFTAIGNAAQINLVIHVYPAWTKASYSSSLLADLVKLPYVTTVKIGTREMSKYDRDLEAIREANPDCTILTCHDEYCWRRWCRDLDGALVGFASFIPELITSLYAAVQGNDLKTAQGIQRRINRLKEVVYASGEPSGEAHARMKTAMMLAGRSVPISHGRRSRPPSGPMLEKIRQAVAEANLQPAPGVDVSAPR